MKRFLKSKQVVDFPLISFAIADDEMKENLRASISSSLLSKQDWTIVELNALLNAIVNRDQTNENAHKRLQFEKLQLSITETVAQYLRKRFSKSTSANEKTAKKEFLSMSGKKVLFWALIVLQFIPGVIGGFLGIKGMLQLIPGIPDPITYIGSLLICAIESILYYGMMSPLFKRALGLPEGEDADVFVQNYTEQLTAVNQINELLCNELHCADHMQAKEFSEYNKFAKLCNEKILTVKNTLPDFQESNYKVAIRWGFSAVNQALTVAGVYYMVTALLTLLAAPLVGTPIGWGIIVVLIVGQLAANFALRNDGMFYILNPKAQRHHELKEKLAEFTDKSADIEQILDKKLDVKMVEIPPIPSEANFESYSSLLYPRSAPRTTGNIVADADSVISCSI